MTDTHTRIYIANLGKYNEGKLVGKWINLPCTDEELEKLFVEIGVGEYDNNGNYVNWHYENGICYEEVAIHDYETDLEIEINEYEDIMEMSEFIEQIEEFDEEEIDVFNTYLVNVSDDRDDALEVVASHEYNIYYDCTDEGDVAQQCIEEQYGNLPKKILDYIDYDEYARDHFDNLYQMESGNYVEFY